MTLIRRPQLRRRTTFGLLGLVISGGAPAGLLVMRLATGQAALGALAEEWSREWQTYVYVAVSTAVAFTAFGAVLGGGADRLRQLATIDSVTGLQNRSGLTPRLEMEIRRAERYAQALSVVLLDLDGLKDINDRYGHATGDEALARIGAAIREGCRTTDVAGRWGGDEFLVVAPSTTLDDAMLLGDRIRHAVTVLPGTPPLTVSVGVASAARDAVRATPEGLLRAADDALYGAKRAGRNRVVAEVARDRRPSVTP
jgi:diguanylate cyclase (GGDEF)-like protein